MSEDLVCCMKRNSGRAGLEIKGATKAKSKLVFMKVAVCEKLKQCIIGESACSLPKGSSIVLALTFPATRIKTSVYHNPAS